MNEQPTYYAVIPAVVRYDKTLSPFARLMFGEFTCLSNKSGYCFASNNYFAELYDVTPQAVSKWIKSLENKGYIKIKYIYDGKEIKERRIYIMGVSTYDWEGINTGLRGYQRTIKDNNTRDNNTRDNSRANARPEQNVDNSVDIVDNSRQCKKSDCQKLKEIYVNNYSELYQQHVVTTPNPIINWAIAMKNLNAAIKSYGYDIIEKALKNSVHDDFVIKNGYSLITILSSGVLSGLVNGGRVINGNRSLASQMDFDVVHDDDIRF